MQVALRQVEISRGMFQVGVAQQKLDRPQVSAGFQQGCREAVAERVRTNPLLDSGAFRGFAADVPDCMVRNRLLDAAVSFGAREEMHLWTLPSKILPQSF